MIPKDNNSYNIFVLSLPRRGKLMNIVGWFEIYVDDIEKGKEFYQKVFQTELKPLSNPGIDCGRASETEEKRALEI